MSEASGRNRGTLPEPNEYGLIDAGEDRFLHLPSTPHVRINDEVYVEAETFMDVQKERDDLRRALAFLNAWRTRPHWWEDPEYLHRVLASVGMTLAEGRATEGVLRFVAQEESTR